jgi:YD repeat-containing protein
VVDDLVTEYRFDVFGGLFQIVLPEGNVIEYSYDSVGRLTTIERKPDDQSSSHGERVVYTYEGAGNRVLEEQETWDGATWVKRSQTETIYSTRCQADKIIRGFGGEEITTEFAYDCDGNLERVWDANHPSAGQTTPATSEYSYDDLGCVEEIQQPFSGAGGGTVVTGYRPNHAAP